MIKRCLLKNDHRIATAITPIRHIVFIWWHFRYVVKKQWTQKKVDNASDETINKIYVECKQRKLNNEKGVSKEKS